MILEVWDKDTSSADDLVGTTNYHLTTVLKSKKANEWIEIRYKGKKSGDVKIEFEFFPDKSGEPKAPAAPSVMYVQQPGNLHSDKSSSLHRLWGLPHRRLPLRAWLPRCPARLPCSAAGCPCLPHCRVPTCGCSCLPPGAWVFTVWSCSAGRERRLPA